MQKKLSITILALTLTLGLFAQENGKTGFGFGIMPAIGYNSDLGFHLGGVADIYYYGDGSTYPDYLWKTYAEALYYFKGNLVLHGAFDSSHLIPGLRVAASVSYFKYGSYSFYGFNGASSLNPAYDKAVGIDGTVLADGTTGMGWYLMKRNIFRAMAGVQGKIGGEGSSWGWAGGMTFYSFSTGDTVNPSRIDTSLPSLYKTYADLGVIPQDEAAGGKHLELKAGVVYDTRDHENNPHCGTDVELYMFGAPALFKGTNPYLDLAFHFKKFVPFGDRVVWASHLAYQGNIAGKTPFYMLQTIQSINLTQSNNEGLGSVYTFRGTTSNRLIAKGYAWFNTDLRVTAFRFNFLKRYVEIVLYPFIDGGYIVQPYNLDKMQGWTDFSEALAKAGAVAATQGRTEEAAGYATLLAADTANDNMLSIYDPFMEKNLHLSTGLGIRFFVNHNVNVGFEFARVLYNSSANPSIADSNWLPTNDGALGINMGMNYIF